METVAVPKEIFVKILSDAETLLDDVESALDMKVKQRIRDITSGIVKGRSEEELDQYLRERGVAVE